MTEPILSVQNVFAGYGQIEVLKGISIDVLPGEIVTIIGANGAGKTSTLMTISGIVRARSGEVSFCGENITTVAPHDRVLRGLVQVPEGRKIFPRLTVLENLELGSYLQKPDDESLRIREHVFSLFPILKERSSQLGGLLSGGEQQMLAIGRALMSRPKLLMMDEPSMGIAPKIVDKIFGAIQELNKEGLTILLVEQNAHRALGISKRGYVLELGTINMSGLSSKLLSDSSVQQAYLGE